MIGWSLRGSKVLRQKTLRMVSGSRTTTKARLRRSEAPASQRRAILHQRLLCRPNGLLAMTLSFIFFFPQAVFSEDSSALLGQQNRIPQPTTVIESAKKNEPVTAGKFQHSKTYQVAYSSYAGDLLHLGKNEALIYGGDQPDRISAKIINTETGDVIKNLALHLGGNENGIRLLGDVSDNLRFIALVSKPQNDPDVESVTGPTRVYLFAHPYGEDSWIEISLVDEMLQPDEIAFNPSPVRRVEKVSAVKVDNDGTVYLLGQMDEFRMIERSLGQSWSVGGIDTVDFFVKSYKAGHFLGEKRFNLPDASGKRVLFNRLDFVRIGTKPNQKELIVYGPPAGGSLTAVKFKRRLEKQSYLRIENVKGDYAEVAQDGNSILIMNAVKWDPDGKFLRIYSLETGELLASSHNLGTFSFPGSFHRAVWDRETASYLIHTTKPSENGEEQAYLHWVKDHQIRSTNLAVLLQRFFFGEEKFSLWGMAIEGDKLIFSLGTHHESRLVALSKNDFFSYLENLPAEVEIAPKTTERAEARAASKLEQVQMTKETEALQVFDEQGRLDTEISVDQIKDFDWGNSEATLTFSKPGVRDGVVAEVYDGLDTLTEQKKISAGFSILADYDAGTQQFFVIGRLRLRVHTSYAEEWMHTKNYVLIRDNQTGELMQAYDLTRNKSVLEEVNAVMKEVMKKVDEVNPLATHVPLAAPLVPQNPVFAYDYPGTQAPPVPAQDFKANSDPTISLDTQGRPVSMMIMEGKVFLDWTKRTAAFVRSVDGTRVDYAQIELEESQGHAQSNRQPIALFSQGDKNLLISGRPNVMSYTDGSYDWILSMNPVNIAFFSSDGTLLDIHFEGQSLRENLQTAEVLLEMQLKRLDDEQLVSILTGLQNIADGIQAQLEASRFLNDPRSLLQIQEILDEAEETVNDFKDPSPDQSQVPAVLY